MLWALQVVQVVKNSSVNARDIRDKRSIPGLGRSPGGGQDNPLQYSCLENSMDRGAWRATVHGITSVRRALIMVAALRLRYMGTPFQRLLL